MQVLDETIKAHLINTSSQLSEYRSLYTQRQAAQSHVRSLKQRVRSARDVLQLEELKCRKRVLRRLGFTTSDDIVETKGRVACEISSGDELLLTEMIFNGVFNSLAPEQCAALLSCFVFSENVGTGVWSVSSH
jgi:ATP-dependent RNA helicase DOB1